ncbi:MAG: FKBP-type peptidyl-prolyl cis-trans isomerase N-terminal domain-containing protein, partial [Desulfobulbaceae bacterium]
MKYTITLILSFVLLTGTSFGGEKTPITDPADRISYSLGYQIGGDLRRQDRNVNLAAVLQGINDAQAGRDPQLNSEEMGRALISLKKDIVQAQQEDHKQ